MKLRCRAHCPVLDRAHWAQICVDQMRAQRPQKRGGANRSEADKSAVTAELSDDPKPPTATLQQGFA